MTVVQPAASGDGKIHGYHSGHITPALPNVGTAVSLAGKVDVTVGQPSRYGGGVGGAFSDDMIAANPALLMFPYQKGVQYQGAGSDFPDRWYSHRLDGTKLFFQQFSVFIMESTGYSVAKTFGGVSGTNWRTWHAAKIKQELDASNAAVPGDPWCGFWLDSLGPRFSYSVGPPAKPGAGRNYTIDEWQLQVLSNPDYLRTTYPTLPTWANGFNTDIYGQQLVSHVDGIWREGWLRGASAAVGAYPTTAKWRTDLQQLIDAQASIPVAVTVKVWTTATVGQMAQWRNYTAASYLIADSGRLYYEFMQNANTGPWSNGEWEHPIYAINLGAPLDTHALLSGYQTTATSGVYYRRYTDGAAIVNTTTAAVSVTLDRAYKGLDGVAVSSPLSVPANSGRVLLTTATTPPLPDPPPVVTITTPATGSTVTVSTVALSATVTADAGIASVSWRILGTTDWQPLTHVSGDTYGQTITLNSQPGSAILNTVSVRCIDTAGQSTSDVVEVTSNRPFRRRWWNKRRRG